jgi:O-acetylhomoserine (thiol)-lyase
MDKYNDATILQHAGQIPDPVTGSRAVPVYQTTSYVFKSAEHAAKLFALEEAGNIYTRITNPTTAVLEERLAAMDGGVGALAASSGMAAIFLAVTNLAKAGDHIISSASLYGGTQTLFQHTLSRFGIQTTFLEDFTPENIKKAVKPETKLVYCETVGNPKGDVPDISAVAAEAHKAGLPLIIDNTFAPLICKPFKHGADIVVYSCTKWIGGHGTSIGGMIVDSGKFDWAASGRFPEFTEPDGSYHGLVYTKAFGAAAFIAKARVQGLRNTGPCCSPLNSFLLLQGAETLHLRMKAHCGNALELASHLKKHPKVAWVNYVGLEDHPWHSTAKRYLNGGFTSVFGFGVKGGRDAAVKFIGSVKLASHLANVGDAKTLVIHPDSTTHQQLDDKAKLAAGVNPEFIRVSVGIEDIRDIIADFDQALA